MVGAAGGLTVPSLPLLLTCQSYFSEGRSTISPKRQAQLAKAASYAALGLTDWCSVAGAVELCSAAREHKLGTVIGTTLPILFHSKARTTQAIEPFPLVLLAKSRAGYAALCELITHVKLESEAGVPLDVLQAVTLKHAGQLVCLTGGRQGFPTVLGEKRELARAAEYLRTLRTLFPFDLYIQLYHGEAPNERRRLGYLRGLARDLELPGVAAPEVCMGSADEYPLLDALSCGRLGIDVNTPHPERPRNDAAHVATPEHWGQLLPFPDALLNAEKIAAECQFDLLPEHLSYPDPHLRPFQTAQEALEKRAFAALDEKYAPDGRVSASERLRSELAIVQALDMAGFFLTAAEVTDYCKQHGILAAGRGSAAGSVICYLLGITLSDPIKHNLLFERFLHTGLT